MIDFKTSYRCGKIEGDRWKDPGDCPIVGLEEDCAKLQNILAGRLCSTLRDKDILAWSPDPKGSFIVASGYQELLACKFGGVEVPWWKHVWNKFSWLKCNCFVWTLASNKCLTWDNLHKQGF